MVTIKIGGSERNFNEVTEDWIHQQINRCYADGLNMCVKVSIKQGPLDLLLTTPECPSGVLRKRCIRTLG